MYAIFFNSMGETLQIPIPKGKSVTGKLYRDLVLKKFEKHLKKHGKSVGLRGVKLLQDNAPAHTSEVVKTFLENKGVELLPHPPYSPDLAPCDFWLFPNLKKHLQGRRYRSRNAVGFCRAPVSDQCTSIGLCQCFQKLVNSNEIVHTCKGRVF